MCVKFYHNKWSHSLLVARLLIKELNVGVSPGTVDCAKMHVQV